LRLAVAIPQVKKQGFAVIARRVNPAAQRHTLANMFGT
jgi:hypothetical protein